MNFYVVFVRSLDFLQINFADVANFLLSRGNLKSPNELGLKAAIEQFNGLRQRCFTLTKRKM